MRNEILHEHTKWEQEAETLKRTSKSQRGLVSYLPKKKRKLEKSLDDKKKWKSEKFKLWSLPFESLQDHITIGASLKGIPGRHGAYGWSVVQLDHDGEAEPTHASVGVIEAGVDVQRAMKRADVTAFQMALRGFCPMATSHTDNICILSGLHRGEDDVYGPESQRNGLWINNKGRRIDP